MAHTYNMEKTEFTRMLAKKGYESIADFAHDCGLYPQSVFTQVRGQHRPTIDRMFMYADTLEVPVEDVIKLFYKDEWDCNRVVCNLE